MPRVPQSRRQVKSRAVNAPQSNIRRDVVGTANSAGAIQKIGQDVGGALQSLENINQRNLDIADKTELDRRETQLRDYNNEILHGDGTKENPGFLKTKGRNTVDSYKEVNKKLADFLENQDKDEEVNASPRVKERMQEIAKQYQVSLDKSMDIHTGQEMDAYHTEQTKSNLASIQNDAVLNYMDHGKVGASLKEQQNKISLYAKEKGLSPEATKDMQLQASTSLSEGVINRALNNDQDRLAKEWFKQNKETMTADSQSKMEKILHGASVKGDSQRATDDIMSANAGLGDSLEAARKIKDPEVRDATVTRVRNRWNEQEQVKKQKTKDDFSKVVETIEAMGSIDKVPMEEKQSWNAKKKKAVEKSLALISKGAQPTTDPVVQQDLMIMASDPSTRQKFLDTDINEHAHELSSGDRKQLLGMQNDLRKGDSKAEAKIGRFQTDTQLMNGTLDELEISDKADRAKFRSQVTEQANQWMQDNGKSHIPNRELKQIADRFGAEVTVKGFFFNSDKKLFKVKDDDVITGIDIDNIPDTAKRQIRQSLGRNGRSFTEKDVENVYFQSLQQELK